MVWLRRQLTCDLCLIDEREIGVCYAFVEFEDISGIQNAIKASTLQIAGQRVFIEERRANRANAFRGGNLPLTLILMLQKLRVPIRGVSAKCESHFLLDFGHFTLRTKEGQPGDQGRCLYSRFYISGRDLAAFFTECDSQSCTLSCQSSNSIPPISPVVEDAANLCSLIDRCGMAVIVDQIKVAHPS